PVGHSISATVELDREITLEQATAAFRGAPGIEGSDAKADPTPHLVAGSDVVRVGHVRIDPDHRNVVHCWVVVDNLRKGAATNAVQIAEQVCRG
ncbi:MAG: Asd/ArgC dimerization domain-containing protein, partial [Longimicrobiales bacterium]